jgi:hypothetical protein
VSLPQFLIWLEGSGLGQFTRSLGLWSYGAINLVHIIGIALLFGAIILLDLRLLGAWRQVPLAALSGPTTVMARIGFALAATSGIFMLSVNASEYIGNPFLLVKFPAIGLALLNVLLVHRTQAWQAHRHRALMPRERKRLAVGAALSLTFWLTAIFGGRMLGYW